MIVGDSIVTKADIAQNKGGGVMVCFPGTKIQDITEKVENNESWQWSIYSGTRRD